jgi:hypothetical protein
MLTQVDLVLKIAAAIIATVLTVGGLVFVAGKWWATFLRLVGSVEALHRRMTEAQQERQHREETIDAVLMQIRLDIRAIQTWKSTMRFRAPEAAAAEQDMFVIPEGDR